MSALSKRVSKARANEGLTQEALAERLKVTRAACSHWEQGISKPSTKNLEKLAIILEVSHEWLAVGRGDMYVNVRQDAGISSSKRGSLEAAEARGEYNTSTPTTDVETAQFSRMFFALTKTDRKLVMDMLKALAPKKRKKPKAK